MKLNADHGKIILRISLSLVFLWFGINQLISPADWLGFVPAVFLGVITAKTLIFINASFEIIFGLLLICGLYVRIAALILGLHLLGISFSLGYSALAVRDFGLSLATIAICFFGEDKICVDYLYQKKV